METFIIFIVEVITFGEWFIMLLLLLTISAENMGHSDICESLDIIEDSVIKE